MVSHEQPYTATLDESVLDTHLSITNVRAESVELSLTEPMTLSFGTFSSRPSGWLALECEVDGQSVTGYGEGATLPRPVFTDDCGDNITTSMTRLALAAANGTTPTLRDAIQAVRDYRFDYGKRYPTARLATEMALLDAATKAHNKPMRDFIGIPAEITELPYGKSIGGGSKADIVRQAREALGNDAQKIKIKVSPHLIDEVMGAIDTLRQDYTGLDIMVDANGAFDPQNSEHLTMLSRLDKQGLIMIEEPVSRVGNLRGLEAVRQMRRALPNLRTPICLDDCLQNIQDCETALNEGLAEVINIKPGRIGSFVQSLELAHLAAAQDTQVMVGGMLEGTPGRCMTTLLGAYCLRLGFTVPGDLSLAQERLSSDLVAADKQLALGPRGGIVLPNGPGWGF